MGFHGQVEQSLFVHLGATIAFQLSVATLE
jgi:hypothetical protein